MIHASLQAGTEQAQAVLRVRCEELGLALWRIDTSGRVIQKPTVEGPAGPWYSCRSIGRAISNEASKWNALDRPEIVEIMPGCWIIPLVLVHRRRRSGYAVMVALGHDALETEGFARACGEAELDAQATRQMLAPEAIWTCETVQRVAMLLEWSSTDQQALAINEATLAGFSSQLSDSFEEMSLLYSLGRALNELEHPQKFVKLACEELLATLAFSWIGVRFVTDPKLARSVTNRLYVSGELPCESDAFSDETARIVDSLRNESSMILQGADLGSLANVCDSVLVHPIMRDGFVVGALLAGGKSGADAEVSSFDRKLLDAASGQVSILLDNAFLYDDQQLMFIGILEALSASIDAKDPYTRGHSERVSHLAACLARAHGLDEVMVDRLRIAGLVHDIGKIGVPESVLCKAGRLTPSEYELMRQHPEIGYHILKDIPLIEDLLPAVLHHHERTDGNGYPHGLRGDEIPLFARIICVVDSFDAMSSNRTYRHALTRKEVISEMRANASSQFDPALVESFSTIDLTRYDQLVARHQGEVAVGFHGLRKVAAA